VLVGVEYLKAQLASLLSSKEQFSYGKRNVQTIRWCV